jgi:3-dehydroquinate synthase
MRGVRNPSPGARFPAHVRVESAGGPYEVRLGAGVLDSLPLVLAEVAPASRYVVIADDVVDELYAERVATMLDAAGEPATRLCFPAGEASKTRETWARLSDAMLAAGCGRDCAVVALGGGVVGDIAGFVAATFMRGVPVVQVPTTLLAMVDASVGGKTGVDVPAGKNLIGAFHPPRAVVADPDTLRTLPLEQLRAGLAEAVKHGAIADADHLAWIEASREPLLAAEPAVLAALIRRSVEIKARIVMADEHEQGERRLLNFGHTLGHAIEAASGYRLLHGEAVAIGMVLEARLGERLGLTEPGTAEALRQLLDAIGLPTALPPAWDATTVVAATRTDKKAHAGRVRYALLRRPGEGLGEEAGWAVAVADEVLVQVLASEG